MADYRKQHEPVRRDGYELENGDYVKEKTKDDVRHDSQAQIRSKAKVFSYEQFQEAKLRKMEKDIAFLMKDLKENYQIAGLDYLVDAKTIDDYLKGKADFEIVYEPDGVLRTQRLDKGNQPKNYTLKEQFTVLNGLKKYGSHMYKAESHKKRHGTNKSTLESKITGAAAVVGIMMGLFLITGNVTGNVIVTQPIGSSFLEVAGIVALLSGIMSAGVYFKKKN